MNPLCPQAEDLWLYESAQQPFNHLATGFVIAYEMTILFLDAVVCFVGVIMYIIRKKSKYSFCQS